MTRGEVDANANKGGQDPCVTRHAPLARLVRTVRMPANAKRANVTIQQENAFVKMDLLEQNARHVSASCV